MSKSKFLVLLATIIIILPGIFYGCMTSSNESPTDTIPQPQITPETDEVEETPGTNTAEESSDAVMVEVVYFHRIQRCHSCTYAEEQTVYTLETYFKDEMDSGKITFQSVNVENENNAIIVEKYGAYTSQLFINVINGDTENIEEIQEFWDFIDDDEGFSNMIITKVNEALEGAD